jgi:hypothetical protein
MSTYRFLQTGSNEMNQLLRSEEIEQNIKVPKLRSWWKAKSKSTSAKNLRRGVVDLEVKKVFGPDQSWWPQIGKVKSWIFDFGHHQLWLSPINDRFYVFVSYRWPCCRCTCTSTSISSHRVWRVLHVFVVFANRMHKVTKGGPIYHEKPWNVHMLYLHDEWDKTCTTMRIRSGSMSWIVWHYFQHFDCQGGQGRSETVNCLTRHCLSHRWKWRNRYNQLHLVQLDEINS